MHIRCPGTIFVLTLETELNQTRWKVEYLVHLGLWVAKLRDPLEGKLESICHGLGRCPEAR